MPRLPWLLLLATVSLRHGTVLAAQPNMNIKPKACDAGTGHWGPNSINCDFDCDKAGWEVRSCFCDNFHHSQRCSFTDAFNHVSLLQLYAIL